MHVESINSYTTVLYMVLGLATVCRSWSTNSSIYQSMSDEVKVLIFLLAKTFDRVLHVSANCNVCTGISLSMCTSTLIAIFIPCTMGLAMYQSIHVDFAGPFLQQHLSISMHIGHNMVPRTLHLACVLAQLYTPICK